MNFKICAWLRPLTPQTRRFDAPSVCLSCSALFAVGMPSLPIDAFPARARLLTRVYERGAGIVPAHAVHARGRGGAERADLQRGVHEHPASGGAPPHCTLSHLPWVLSGHAVTALRKFDQCFGTGLQAFLPLASLAAGFSPWRKTTRTALVIVQCSAAACKHVLSL